MLKSLESTNVNYDTLKGSTISTYIDYTRPTDFTFSVK